MQSRGGHTLVNGGLPLGKISMDHTEHFSRAPEHRISIHSIDQNEQLGNADWLTFWKASSSVLPQKLTWPRL